jgi:hypothetical protein
MNLTLVQVGAGWSKLVQICDSGSPRPGTTAENAFVPLQQCSLLADVVDSTPVPR